MGHYIGVDPDTTKLTAVIIDESLTIERVCMVRAPKGVKGREAVVWIMAEGMIALKECMRGFLHLNVHALAVEGQQVYASGSTGAKPQDIVQLASVAGGVYSMLYGVFFPRQAYFPLPREWKGSIQKGTHQARLLKRLELPYRVMGGKGSEYPVPVDAFLERIQPLYRGTHKMNPGDWKDINDSLGLAVWARDMYNKRRMK